MSAGDTVPALPLWQPWASLVALGAKRVETRHWPCPRRLLGSKDGMELSHGFLSKQLSMCTQLRLSRC